MATREARNFPAQIEALYHDAVENLRFVKQQQWRVTNYALLIYAAVFFAHKESAVLQSCPWKAALTVALVVTLAFSWGVLFLLENSMGNFRDRVQWVYGRYFTSGERRDLVLEPKTFWFDKSIFIGLLVVSTAGALLALTLVWGKSPALVYCTVPLP